jgi:hypothetical protein
MEWIQKFYIGTGRGAGGKYYSLIFLGRNEILR